MKVKEFSLYYQNVRGLRTKSTTFLNNLVTEEYGCIILNETWLDSDIYSSELFDSRYHVFRCDRNKIRTGKVKGGGVLIAVNQQFKSELIVTNSILETVTVKVNVFGKVIVISTVYFAPRSLLSSYQEYFNMLENIQCLVDNELIIVGDFNVPEINTASYNFANGNHIVKSLNEFMNFFNLNLYNNILNSENKTLDLVISSFELQVNQQIDSLVPIDVFHPALVISKNFNFSNPLINDSIESVNMYNYRNADFNLLYELLYHTEWNVLNRCSDVNVAVDKFYEIMYNIIERSVPRVTRKRNKRSRYPVWFTKEIISDIRGKMYHHRRRIGSDYHQQEFRRLRLRIKRNVQLAYKNYISSVENSINVNVNEFWNYVKNKKKDHESNQTYSHQGRTALNYAEASQFFAEHFSSVYTDGSLYDLNVILSESNQPALGVLNIGFLEIEEVAVALKSLKPKKSAGPDLIPCYIFKACWEILQYPLTLLYNLALNSNTFPDKFKMARVIPIFKSGDKRDVKNYRPISILSVPAKVFEKILYNKIFYHVKTSIATEQHGFFEGRSVDTNLITFTNFASEIIDSGGQMDVVYTDFAKAFDTVNHDVLLKKLYEFGMSNELISLLKSYLRNRYQFVGLNGCNSDQYLTTSGVPQGSNLGPLLFLILINDLPSCVKYSQSLLFADDLKIFKAITSNSDAELFQKDIHALVKWSNSNKLFFNIEKCKVMTYSLNKIRIHSNYTMNGNILRREYQVKDLGVFFNDNLKWDQHIDYIVNSSLKNLGFLIRNTANFLTIKSIIILYNSIVRSKLEYASKVWNSSAVTNVAKIETVQNKFLKYIHFKKYGYYPEYGSYHRIRCEFQIFKLHHRREIIDLLFLCKLINNRIDCPKLLPLVSLYVPAYRTRPRSVLHVPTYRTDLRRNSPMIRLPMLANSFIYDSDANIFNTSVHSFKMVVHKHYSNKFLQ